VKSVFAMMCQGNLLFLLFFTYYNRGTETLEFLTHPVCVPTIGCTDPLSYVRINQTWELCSRDPPTLIKSV